MRVDPAPTFHSGFLPSMHLELNFAAACELVLIDASTTKRWPMENWPALVALQRGNLPGALQIEQQIETVENWLMPVLKHIPAAARDGALHFHPVDPLLHWAGSDAALNGASIEQIEACFNHVADIASGQPPRADAPPLDAMSVARLIVLREVLHHGGFRRVMGAP